MTQVPVRLQLDIEHFLAIEAETLDEGRLDDWIDILAEDVHYFMPVRESILLEGAATAPPAAFALFDDDKNSLRVRIGRSTSGVAPTDVPPPTTQRLITNVRIAYTAHVDEFAVRSNFMVYQERRGRHGTTFYGTRRDLLRRRGDGFEIVKRHVELAQATLPATISIMF